MPTVIGILGAAGIAPAAVLRPALRRDDVVVAAVASRRDARGYADRFGIERAYDSYEKLLADPGVDLVYNALPPSLHAVWSIAALAAGKHVLCEKPFTMNAAEAERVVEAAERSGRRAIEAFHDHYHPLSGWVRRFLAEHGLGTVRRIEAVFTGATPFDPASIRHDPALGGGALMDLGCYPIHWLRAALGAEPEVRRAKARLNPLGADLEIEADLEFPGGVAARVFASMAEGVALASTLHVEGERGCCTSTTWCSRRRGTASRPTSTAYRAGAPSPARRPTTTSSLRWWMRWPAASRCPRRAETRSAICG